MIEKGSSKSVRISDVILEQLNNMILAGTYKAGEKLPPERELAEQLSTSRPSVRAALSKLESQGLITRVQGGGNYVSDKIESSFSDPLLALFEEKEDFKYDVLEYRHALEEACCFLAAEKATPEEKQNIQQKYDDWLVLHNAQAGPDLEAEADLAFHLSIAEATHNFILPHAMKSSLNLIEKSVSANLKTLYSAPDRRKKVVEQHTDMLKSILASNGELARISVREHLEFVKTTLEKADIHQLREGRLNKSKSI